MQYRSFGKYDLKALVIGLGEHEFHIDGRVRGFGDDKTLAVTRRRRISRTSTGPCRSSSCPVRRTQ
ncbi:MAG: hypothetical protein NTW86_14330 [Candidatus Sumerlaeota bacterium]|nr:hypothetical protein [Candidatus Sumerlaeota bacterium]